MASIAEYDTVRVAALYGSPESHLAISDCSRPPAIGDLGTVVGFSPPTSNASEAGIRYIVESNAGPGYLVWLAEFFSYEIEKVSRSTSEEESDRDTDSPSRVTQFSGEAFDNLLEQWLLTREAHDIHRKYVEEARLLPLYSDMGGFYGLTRSRQIVECEWDGAEEPQIVNDPRIINVALFQGAMLYPPLRALLPSRPDDAVVCKMCNGTGRVDLPQHIRNIVCYCGGAGWLPAGTAQMPIASRNQKRWWQFWRR